MPFRILPLHAVLLLALAFTACSSVPETVQPEQASGVELEACQLSNPDLATRLGAECGSLEVPENPSDPSGKSIRLRIAVLQSISRNPAADPLFFIPGGPGEAATESFLVVSSAFERIRQKRDIVLVDQRGTGGSNALRCPEVDEPLDISDSSEAAIRESAQACLASLQAEPENYTTTAAVEDLDRVREALKYERINLYGGSYGTRVALAYLRQFPSRVRAVILDGAAPPNWTLGPDINQDAQRALDLIFKRCAKSPECSSNFPHLPEKFHSLAESLRKQPVQLTLDDPVSGERIDFTLTYDFFASTIHSLTYTPETAALLPLLIHTAYERNDLSLIASQGISNTRLVTQSISIGMRISVICAEDAPFLGETGADFETGYLGDAFIVSYRTICDVWPRFELPAGFKEPVRSDAPVLILSGEADPVTPPRNGELAAVTLPNSLHLVIPGQGHINIFRGCIPALAASFIESGSSQGLNTDCVDSFQPMPFFLTFNGPNP